MTPKRAVWIGVCITWSVMLSLLALNPVLAITFLSGMAAGATLAAMVGLKRLQDGMASLPPESRRSLIEYLSRDDASSGTICPSISSSYSD